MSKVKTIVAMGALLIGIASAQDLSAEGTYSATVSETARITQSGGNATIADAKDILKSNEASPMTLEFTVLTNREKWDLSLEAANGGKLKRADGTPLKTDLVEDGSLGTDGSLLVTLKSISKDPQVETNFAVNDKADVNVNSKVNSLATELNLSNDRFENDGEVENVFEIKAGLAGSNIISPPGTYTEKVTLSFTATTN